MMNLMRRKATKVMIRTNAADVMTKMTESVAKWLRRLTRKPKVRTAAGSNPALDSLVAVRNSSPGQPEQREGNLVDAASSCDGLMVKHPWPLLEISLSDFRWLTTLNIYTYLPTYIPTYLPHFFPSFL